MTLTSTIIPPFRLARDRIPVIELQIQLNHVHRRLPEDPKEAAAGVLRYDCTNLVRADMPSLGHPGDLDVGVGR
ncbi:hypothetical protein MMAN_53890 [Mycobacterium mantenii]|uniref:Uncharacterized protein n=1 Tax=Mycobacterium mantenii TaxID=560555 RepID=A0ABM7K099_MYCNT|nr:hypothetical protein MMAN_53890 [Mycobacterium mantenii]